MTLYRDAYDPRMSDGKWRRHQVGHRWDRGYLVTVERWDVADVGDTSWSSWVEVGRSKERVRRPPQKVVPVLTREELDAWGAWAMSYVSRPGGVTLSFLASVMPGWDDVETFWPGRNPGDWNSEPIWTLDDPVYVLARTRARALAGVVLRHLVRTGRARQVSESSRWVVV